MEPFIAQIMLFGGNFAPRGWAFCDGQLLPILSNTSLFSIIGTTYGGDGRTSFALPDLRSRVPMHAGQGPGLSSRRIGQQVGVEHVTLSTDQLPPHDHEFNVLNEQADGDHRSGHLWARSAIYPATTTPTVALSPTTIADTGGGQPHENMQPTLCINYVIALKGIFPSRS